MLIQTVAQANTCLEDIRWILATGDDDGATLGALFKDLDTWLSDGGYIPDSWAKLGKHSGL